MVLGGHSTLPEADIAQASAAMGLAPVTTNSEKGVVSTTNTTAWETLVDHSSLGSGGVVVTMANEPTSSINLDLRITIDGTLFKTWTGLTPVGGNYAIGLAFDQAKQIGPIFFDTGFKIESKKQFGASPAAASWVWSEITWS